MALRLPLVKLASVSAFALLGACAATEGPLQPLPAPGTVLAERSEALGLGYREVARSQVNPPGSFEGIGHFVFVYYRDERLCQCSRGEVVVSPDGSLSLYTDVVDGRLMLFRAGSRERVAITQEFVGYPTNALWDLPAKRATVTLSHGSKNAITVPL